MLVCNPPPFPSPHCYLFLYLYVFLFEGGEIFTISKALLKFKGSYFEDMISSNHPQLDNHGRYSSTFIHTHIAINIDADDSSQDFTLIVTQSTFEQSLRFCEVDNYDKNHQWQRRCMMNSNKSFCSTRFLSYHNVQDIFFEFELTTSKVFDDALLVSKKPITQSPTNSIISLPATSYLHFHWLLKATKCQCFYFCWKYSQ